MKPHPLEASRVEDCNFRVRCRERPEHYSGHCWRRDRPKRVAYQRKRSGGEQRNPDQPAGGCADLAHHLCGGAAGRPDLPQWWGAQPSVEPGQLMPGHHRPQPPRRGTGLHVQRRFLLLQLINWWVASPSLIMTPLPQGVPESPHGSMEHPLRSRIHFEASLA